MSAVNKGPTYEVVMEIDNVDTTLEVHGTRHGVETLVTSVEHVATPRGGPTVEFVIPVAVADMESLRIVSVIDGNVAGELVLTQPS